MSVSFAYQQTKPVGAVPSKEMYPEVLPDRVHHGRCDAKPRAPRPLRGTDNIRALIRKRKLNPFDGLCQVIDGSLPCGECRATGRALYRDDGVVVEDVCRSCHGACLERHIPVELRLKAASELCRYLEPQLKAVEHSGSIDNVNISLAAILDVRLAMRERKEREMKDAARPQAELTAQHGVIDVETVP